MQFMTRRVKVEWHLWFAWHPVGLENGMHVWLETVWKREIVDDYGILEYYRRTADFNPYPTGHNEE